MFIFIYNDFQHSCYKILSENQPVNELVNANEHFLSKVPTTCQIASDIITMENWHIIEPQLSGPILTSLLYYPHISLISQLWGEKYKFMATISLFTEIPDLDGKMLEKDFKIYNVTTEMRYMIFSWCLSHRKKYKFTTEVGYPSECMWDINYSYCLKKQTLLQFFPTYYSNLVCNVKEDLQFISVSIIEYEIKYMFLFSCLLSALYKNIVWCLLTQTAYVAG